VGKGDNQRGQKRKEYRLNVSAVTPACSDLAVLPGTNVPVGALALVTTVRLAMEDGGEDLVADSNKKQKLDASMASSRSADPAETAMQSRPTQ
jgi:hypothetical protein